MPFGFLKKLLPSDTKEALYRKGIQEGFLQGYLEANKKLEGQIQELKSRMEEMEVQSKAREEEMQAKFMAHEEEAQARFKVLEDEVNLLGRLISEISEDKSKLSEKNQELLAKLQSIVDSRKQRPENQLG